MLPGVLVQLHPALAYRATPPPTPRALRGAIARFVSLRRHEALTLHDAVQGMSPRGFDWLPERVPGGKVVAGTVLIEWSC